MNLDRCNFSRNGTGIQAGTATGQINHGVVRIANCMITGNDTGVEVESDGAVSSRLSNGTASGGLTNTIDGNNQYDVLGTMSMYFAK